MATEYADRYFKHFFVVNANCKNKTDESIFVNAFDITFMYVQYVVCIIMFLFYLILLCSFIYFFLLIRFDFKSLCVKQEETVLYVLCLE